jgi:hypothetical protein
MKIRTIITGLAVAFLAHTASAQGQTLVVGPETTNSAILTVSSNSYAVIKRVSADYGSDLMITMQGISFSFDPTTESLNNFTFSGPATVQLESNGYGPGFVTVEVEPGLFPPGKALTVGSHSGNVRVTMQMSADLVNWAPAVNGMVYTNSPDARFFRITLERNAQPQRPGMSGPVPS